MPNTACIHGAERSRPVLQITCTRAEEGGESIDSVALSGELDVYHSKRFRACLDSCEAQHVEIDFRDCSFIDSDGIGVLVSFQRVLRHQGRQMTVLTQSRSAVQRVFDLINAGSLFAIERDRVNDVRVRRPTN